MALFKIEKGLAASLATARPTTNEGWCYFTTDDGKFYIDTATGSDLTKRVCLNAAKADTWKTARNFTITDGTHSGTTVSVDGSKDISLKLPTTITATLSGTASSANKIINTADNSFLQCTYKKDTGTGGFMIKNSDQ